MKRWNQDSYAHHLVAHVQVELAQMIYEEWSSKSDQFYKEWPDRDAFIRQCAPTLRDHARAVLSEQLARHDVPEREKEQIYRALLLDKVIPNEDRYIVPASTFIH